MWSRWLHLGYLQLLWQAQALQGQLQEESSQDIPKRLIPVEVLSTLLGQLSEDGEKSWILKADIHLHSISGLCLVHGCIDIMTFTNFIDRDQDEPPPSYNLVQGPSLLIIRRCCHKSWDSVAIHLQTSQLPPSFLR